MAAKRTPSTARASRAARKSRPATTDPLERRAQEATATLRALKHPVTPPLSPAEEHERRERVAAEAQRKFLDSVKHLRPDPAALAREQELDRRREEETRRRALEASGVGKRYLDVDFAALPDWLPPGYRQVAARLAELLHRPAIVALLGDVGVGKSALGAGLVRLFRDHLKYAYRRNVDEVLREIYEAPFDFRPGLKRKEVVRERYAKVPLLVLDDVQERDSRQGGEIEFSNLIDARYQAERATLITANLDPDDLRVNLGPRIYRRIVETGGIIQCTWPRLETLRPKS